MRQSGGHGGLPANLQYKSTLFFVLDEADQKMATTVTMDTNSLGFGGHGRHRADLLYKSTLFFVLDEAGQKMTTTATMDTKWLGNQCGRVVLIGGPWIPRTGRGIGPCVDLIWTSRGRDQRWVLRRLRGKSLTCWGIFWWTW
jgi:hypothetical protein